MKIKVTYGIIAILLALVLCIKNLWFDEDPSEAKSEEMRVSRQPALKPSPASSTARRDWDLDTKQDVSAILKGAIPNQRILTFKDREAMEQYLARMGAGLRVLGRSDALNSLLVGFETESDLLASLDGSEETSYNFPVHIPDMAKAMMPEDAASLRNQVLDWLGVTQDNSAWGAGVKIAVLDSGIADHLVFKNSIQRINLVDLPADASRLNAHGTAVASLIFSNHSGAPGISPAASPISIRIADDLGSSNSFLLAQGINAAVEAGAQLINISMGGSGRSALVDAALERAHEAGAVVIAASGNAGMEGVMQPAANPLVIAVGAVDAQNQYLAFSNTGAQLAIAAPGYNVNVAYPGDQAAMASGTSFSTPIITGTIAAAMSNDSGAQLSARDAAALVQSYLNDVGAAGSDSYTGAGVPDMWRILNGNTPGIYDAGITSVYADGGTVNLVVQNLGTETMTDANVTIRVNGQTSEAAIPSLGAGESLRVSVGGAGLETTDVQAAVSLGSGQNDQRAFNDEVSGTLSLEGFQTAE
ncbi:MAG: S8 family serine peptidase [Akkermansiaceae bacterium]|nr:S8 family serine peptidase [Akkermansiaceae bacterium]